MVCVHVDSPLDRRLLVCWGSRPWSVWSCDPFASDPFYEHLDHSDTRSCYLISHSQEPSWNFEPGGSCSFGKRQRTFTASAKSPAQSAVISARAKRSYQGRVPLHFTRDLAQLSQANRDLRRISRPFSRGVVACIVLHRWAPNANPGKHPAGNNRVFVARTPAV